MQGEEEEAGLTEWEKAVREEWPMMEDRERGAEELLPPRVPELRFLRTEPVERAELRPATATSEWDEDDMSEEKEEEEEEAEVIVPVQVHNAVALCSRLHQWEGR
jgi:hypothetical protein